MERYAPIHPERPIRRAAIAVVVSLGVHAGLLAILAVVAVAAIAAQKRREAESPKQVALASIEAEQWDANRRYEPEFETRFLADPGGAHPAKGIPGRRPLDGKDQKLLPGSSAKGWAAQEGPELPMPVPDPGAPPASGPTLDLRPRPLPVRPLDLGVKTIGEGGLPYSEGTEMGGLRILHPEAWRYTGFTNRAIGEMNAAYRYKMGRERPPTVQAMKPGYYLVAELWISVRIDRDGRLLEARVRRSSGLPDVDDLVVRIVREAAPFVNLPPGLLGGDGIYSDTWGLRYTRD